MPMRFSTHFAVAGNIADVSAKEGAQETAVSLCGILGGLAFATAMAHLSKKDDHPHDDDYYYNKTEFLMAWAVFNALGDHTGEIEMVDNFDVHHNFAELENHFGHNVWVHRKGATRARKGDLTGNVNVNQSREHQSIAHLL